MTAPNQTYEKVALREVSDALWSDEARIHLSARQVGAVVDILRVSADHGLHRYGLAKCPICKSHRKLEKATRDANGVPNEV